MRSESLATTIVMAAARTASPASCPPMRRGSSGNDDAVDVAFATPRFSWRVALGVGVGLGVTTGNKLVMLPGVTVVPGNPAGVDGNGPVPGGVIGEELGWPSTADTVASAGESDPPEGDWAP